MKKRIKIVQDLNDEIDPSVRLALATRPLLELFAVVNDVFEEDEALSLSKRMISLGRIYEAWKKCRKELDRPFNIERDARAKQYASGGSRPNHRTGTVSKPDRSILRTRPDRGTRDESRQGTKRSKS